MNEDETHITNNRNVLVMESRNCSFSVNAFNSKRITVAVAADKASNTIAWNKRRQTR